MTLIQRYLAGLAGLLVAALGIFWLGHSKGYSKAERHYQPILAQIELDRRFAEADAKRKATRITELETSLGQQLSASREAQRVSGDRIAGLVQDIAACRLQGRAAASDPSGIAEAARIAQRAQQIGSQLAGIAAAAQRDAIRLGSCIDILRAERN